MEANSSAKSIKTSSKLTRPTSLPPVSTTGSRRKPRSRINTRAASIGPSSSMVYGERVITSLTDVVLGSRLAANTRSVRSRSVRIPTTVPQLRSDGPSP